MKLPTDIRFKPKHYSNQLETVKFLHNKVWRIKLKITSPGWMCETSAQTWCTGKTSRVGVEWAVGGGIGIGNTCKPMAVSFQCMTKSTTKKKDKK